MAQEAHTLDPLARMAEENRLMRERIDLMQRMRALDVAPAHVLTPSILAASQPAPVTASRPLATFKELANWYWNTHGKHKVDAATEKGRLVHLVHSFGADTSEEISKTAVSEYYDARLTQVSLRTKRVPEIATINREVALLRRILNLALDDERIPRTRLKRLKLRKESNIREAKLLDPELERVRVQIPNCPGGRALWALVLVLVDSGMREDEGYSLKWTQFDHVTGRCPLLRKQVKGGKNPRKTRISQRALAAVHALPHVGEYVFMNAKRGRRFSMRYLYRLYEEAVARAGLGTEDEPITIHTLRHTFQYKARRFWKLSDRVIMAMMGHSTNAASERYGVVDNAEAEAAFDERDRQMAEAAASGDRKAPQRAPAARDDEQDDDADDDDRELTG